MGFVSVPAAVQANIASLSPLKTVDLSRNNIELVTFNPTILDYFNKSYGKCDQTRLIILSDCQIKTINVEEMVGYPFLHLDILCDCGLKSALEYMYNHSDYFNSSFYKYLWNIQCAERAALNGVTLSQVQVHKLCLNPGVFLVMVIASDICLYRHRATVKALVHNYIFIKCLPSQYVHHQDRNGVFLVYSSEDRALAS